MYPLNPDSGRHDLLPAASVGRVSNARRRAPKPSLTTDAPAETLVGERLRPQALARIESPRSEGVPCLYGILGPDQVLDTAGKSRARVLPACVVASHRRLDPSSFKGGLREMSFERAGVHADDHELVLWVTFAPGPAFHRRLIHQVDAGVGTTSEPGRYSAPFSGRNIDSSVASRTVSTEVCLS